MNSEGAKYLLKDGVSLGSETDLVSFMYFMMARGHLDDTIRRISFFENLSLHFDTPSQDIAGVLAEFFEKIAPAALNFTSLDIHTAEALLVSYPPLGTAIAKLTTLEALELSFGGEHCAVLLRNLQSKLVTANITFGDGEREDEEIPRRDRDPILLLQGSQSTLESLDTSFAVSSPDGPCYANVTSLSLSYMDLPDIEDYIRAFPNLRSLSAFECSGYGDDPETWADRREMSMLSQLEFGTWRSLHHYWGSVLILWTFGLTCRIPSIEIDFDDHELDVEKLEDVLRDVHPSHLVLKLPEASCLLDHGFRSALRVPEDLQVLDLRVTFNPYKDSTLLTGDLLDSLVDIARASSASVAN
uniref:Cell cycle regulatory protein n=1 Tax=Ganoderma boninense TaxID=34458 RepID=A0A5K1K833_9APHY|nr:Cell cycle regulatory protein [Ganoderma boninense]